MTSKILHAVAICAITLVAISGSSCRKAERKLNTPGTPKCSDMNDTLINGQCVVKPHLYRFGVQALPKSQGFWATTSTCSCIDSTIIRFSIDSLSGQPHSVSVNFEAYGDVRGLPGFGIAPAGTISRTYFVDPVRGDSLIFGLLTKCYTELGREDSKSGTFFGRMNLTRDTIRGHVQYSRLSMIPTNEWCGPVDFFLLR